MLLLEIWRDTNRFCVLDFTEHLNYVDAEHIDVEKNLAVIATADRSENNYEM